MTDGSRQANLTELAAEAVVSRPHQVQYYPTSETDSSTVGEDGGRRLGRGCRRHTWRRSL